MPAGRFLAICFGLVLAAGSVVPMQVDAADPAAVDLFFELTGDEPMLAGAGAAEPAAGEIMVGGILLRASARGEAEDSGWGTRFGANGTYTAPSAGPLALSGRMGIARTRPADRNAPATTAASMGADLGYASGRWTLGLLPSFEIARGDAGAVRRDSAVEIQASATIGSSLGIAATGRYGRHHARALEEIAREVATGRLGFTCTVTDRAWVEAAYILQREVTRAGHGGRSEVRSAGPSLAATLALAGTLDLSAEYGFTRIGRYGAAAGRPGWQRQDMHRAALAMAWDIGGEAAMGLWAGYRFERVSAATDDQRETQHAGIVSFVLVF